MAQNVDPITPPGQDDYLVESDEPSGRRNTAARIVHGLQILLIIVMAVLSLALFWVLGETFNIL